MKRPRRPEPRHVVVELEPEITEEVSAGCPACGEDDEDMGKLFSCAECGDTICETCAVGECCVTCERDKGGWVGLSWGNDDDEEDDEW